MEVSPAVQKVIEICAREKATAAATATAEQEIEYTLRLKPVKTWPYPPEQRLRAAVKALLRGYGLRCVELRESQ